MEKCKYFLIFDLLFKCCHIIKKSILIKLLIMIFYKVLYFMFRVDLFANYIDLKLDPGRGLFRYEVKFNPDIDSRTLRKKLLNQHAVKLGHTFSFDGVLLYLPQKFPQEVKFIKNYNFR